MFHFFTLRLEFNDRSTVDISTRTLLIFTSRRVQLYVSHFHHVSPVHERPASLLL